MFARIPTLEYCSPILAVTWQLLNVRFSKDVSCAVFTILVEVGFNVLSSAPRFWNVRL